MIGAKKRFKVLERDNFRCQYCGKNGKDVSLEIDHIIPKAKGGTDDFNNLITCCRECNIGKGKDIIGVSNGNAKIKIIDKENEMIKSFFNERNDYGFGTIDKNNLAFLSGFIKFYFGNYLNGYLRGILDDNQFLEFNSGGDFCDEILNGFYYYIWDNDIIDIFNRIDDKKQWTTTDNNLILNRLISEYIVINKFPQSFNFKHSLFPKQIEEWQQND